MGGHEAVGVLDLLARYGAANRRTVEEYVMEALYAGAEMREGTPAYEGLLESAYREASGGPASADEPVSTETVVYLRRVLASAVDGRDGLMLLQGTHDGFSEAAYQEVYHLLGSRGRRFLGIRGQYESLVPDRRMVRAMLQDEFEAEVRELGHEAASSTEPSSGAPPGIGEPDDWNPVNPMLEAYPDVREHERWEPYWPELEPSPMAEASGHARMRGS